MRASDADRDRVAADLREHCVLGRLTTDELRERIEAVYASRTLGELAELTADLPEHHPDMPVHPVPSSQRYDRSLARRGSGGLAPSGNLGRLAWTAWAAVSGLNLMVWLLLAVTGVVVYPWWIWVAGPWGAVMLITTVTGPPRRR